MAAAMQKVEFLAPHPTAPAIGFCTFQGCFAGPFKGALGLATPGLAVTPREVAHLGLRKHFLVTVFAGFLGKFEGTSIGLTQLRRDVTTVFCSVLPLATVDWSMTP